MKKVKWAIVGTGWISHCFAEAFPEAKNAELVAVCSRRQDTAEAFAAAFGIPEAYGSLEDLFEKSEAEVIYLGTPNRAHLAGALACVRAKKHVVVEKPFATNAREAAEMVKAARENGVFFMEAVWTRFFPALQQAKAWVDAGRIGTPRSIRASFFINNGDDSKWRWDPASCGGSLMDLGIYGLAFSNYFMGAMPSAHHSFFEIKGGIDASGAILLAYGDGQFSQIASSMYYAGNGRAGIFGEKGHILIGPDFWRPYHAELYENHGDIFVSERVETFDEPYAATGYQFEIDGVSECIAQGKTESPLMPMDESVSMAALMEALRRENGVLYPTDL